MIDTTVFEINQRPLIVKTSDDKIGLPVQILINELWNRLQLLIPLKSYIKHT